MIILLSILLGVAVVALTVTIITIRFYYKTNKEYQARISTLEWKNRRDLNSYEKNRINDFAQYEKECVALKAILNALHDSGMLERYEVFKEGGE